MNDLSFSVVMDLHLYLQVHLLDQVKRAASLRVYLSLVAEHWCSFSPELLALEKKQEIQGRPVSSCWLAATTSSTTRASEDARISFVWWWRRSALGRIS